MNPLASAVGGASASTEDPGQARIASLLALAHGQYEGGRYKDALITCEKIYTTDAHRTDNLLLLGACHFQLGNHSECIFYNQQAIRIDPSCAECYGNLGNALRLLGDLDGALQFQLKAIKLKPRFADAYTNLASTHMQLGNVKQAMETFQMAVMLNPRCVSAMTNLGNLHKSQGALEEAKRCYLEALRIAPDHAIAWSNLAGCMKDLGNLEMALAYYEESIRHAPTFADAHSNYGNALKEARRLEDAKAAYRRAIALKPDFAIATGNLASCYYDEGDMKAAVSLYKHAIQLEPNFPDAFNNLGNAYRELGLPNESLAAYKTALSLKPDHPHAYNNLGNSLKDKGMVKEAVHCYTTAIRLMPTFAAAHSNLASVLKEQGKIQQAIAHYQRAIHADRGFADAWCNLGNAYKDVGYHHEAIQCYTTAIQLKPTFADALANLASSYKDMGRVEEAIVLYREALKNRPNFPDAFSNLVHSLILICNWATRESDFEQLRSLMETQVTAALEYGAAVFSGRAVSGAQVIPPPPAIQPFHALVYPFSLSQLRRLSQAFAERTKINVSVLEMPAFKFRARKPGQRLKIGYVSSDFGNHPLSHLMQSVFVGHDTSQFEVFCYALSAADGSPWRATIEGGVEHFKVVAHMLPGDIARLIHSDGVHVLVNLNGYTKGARNEIFALKPAPIQVSYMGFCGTLGADYVDYMVLDRSVVPPSSRHGFSEALVYMPHSYFVNDHKQSAQEVLDPTQTPTRAQYGIPEDKFVFGNFNQIYKLDPATFAAWMNILKHVPDSVLWLLRFPPTGESNIRAEAAAHGIPDGRIIFTDVAQKSEHIRRGALVDLFLDTPVCNAHTTGCDALWSGTPMLTLPGERLASRVAASLLNAVGLPELITSSLDHYQSAAVELATNMDKLLALRSKLDTNRLTCPLFDTHRWIRNFEAGFKLMWSRHEMGLAPADIDVADVRGGPDTVLPPVAVVAKGFDGPTDPPSATGTREPLFTPADATGRPGVEPMMGAVPSVPLDGDSAGGPV